MGEAGEETELARALRRRDEAIAEMHHRVGNMLAICAATIRLLEARPDIDPKWLRSSALERLYDLGRQHQRIAKDAE